MTESSNSNHICICKYPLFIIDNRDGREIEYIAMPIEVVKDGDMPVPSIDYEDAIGFDGIKRRYIKVQWQQIQKGDIITKHDVVGHIVYAGCGFDEARRGRGEEDGNEGLRCDEKSIYVVYHPENEWASKHVIILGEQNIWK